MGSPQDLAGGQIGGGGRTVILGEVIGHAVSTIKHPSLEGWRLVLCRPVRIKADPLLALDPLDAGVGNTVVLSNDGRSARAPVGDTQSPARRTVIGIVDDAEATGG